MSAADPWAGLPAVSEAGAGGRLVSTYVALGDSFTAGRGSIEAERWADRLAGALRAANPELAYRNLAVDGASSADVLAQLPAAIALQPDLVTVICGANDVLLSTRPDVAGYERRFAKILTRLWAELPPGAAILTATAPQAWHFMELRPRTEARLAKALTDLNTATLAIADYHHIPCLGVAGHPGLTDRANFSADGLHPSSVGHERAAEEISRALRERFGIRCDPKHDFQGGT